MNIEWEVLSSPAESGVKAKYLINSVAQLEADFAPLLAACVNKAVGELHSSIQDDSLYLIFEFDESFVLNVVVADDSKLQESPYRVVCDMASLQPYLDESTHWKFKDEGFADIVKHEIRDYLSTCSGFMRYSLVAVFSEGDRSKTELL
ncbi:hypothetical protein [Zhongshania aliphaticivorans]|uniref:hypothetical protein n=1 Tax=Zhongshania aliphaticivorans TaxID=1470434 RepID=UPI0012E4CEB4|nr:hypothetical protein [Zhongshania aliphaticivorans]CAA0101763.1 Uncharacterised protein [Zhongshania aliphaticivorans]